MTVVMTSSSAALRTPEDKKIMDYIRTETVLILLLNLSLSLSLNESLGLSLSLSLMFCILKFKNSWRTSQTSQMKTSPGLKI